MDLDMCTRICILIKRWKQAKASATNQLLQFSSEDNSPSKTTGKNIKNGKMIKSFNKRNEMEIGKKEIISCSPVILWLSFVEQPWRWYTVTSVKGLKAYVMIVIKAVVVAVAKPLTGDKPILSHNNNDDNKGKGVVCFVYTSDDDWRWWGCSMEFIG